jgi:hypothetical protein
LIKSFQNKWVILGQELTETTLANGEFGHNARSATLRCVFFPHFIQFIIGGRSLSEECSSWNILYYDQVRGEAVYDFTHHIAV